MEANPDKKRKREDPKVAHEEHHQGKKHEPDKNGDEGKLSWHDIVVKTTVGDLCERKAKKYPLVVLRDTDTLKQAMTTLEQHGILSAPVLDSHLNFLGFVDVLDIAGFILTSYGKKSDRFDDPHFVKDEFFQSEVKKLLNFSKVDAPVTVTEDNTIEDLVKLFADPSKHHRLHRVAVVDPHKKVINVVSQSDIIALAVANLDTIPEEKRNTTLDDLKIVRNSVFARIDDPFVDALETLYQHRVSGIALVDGESRISTNFSASDLRGMNEHAFRYFSGSALCFLIKGTDAKLGAPVSCMGSTTFGEALKLVFDNRVHRLYTVNDAAEHIHGVVSISDLVPLLA